MHNPCQSFQSSSHCGKCGRRSRQTNSFKCSRDNHDIASKTTTYPAISQNTSSPTPRTDFLIDQFIQVQQIDPRKCLSLPHKIKDEYQSKSNRTRSIDERDDSNRWHHVRQMIYLRENINNSLFRLIPFASQYVIVKRLEESNHLQNKNRIKVDHLFRPFAIHYQTMSREIQNIIIPISKYVREDTTITPTTFLNSSNNNNNSQSRTILLSWLQNTNDFNQQSLTSDSLQHTESDLLSQELQTIDRTAPFDQILVNEIKSTSSSSSTITTTTTTTTSNTRKRISLKYNEAVDKMKRLVELLRLHLMKKSNIIKTMTLDSLESTTSVHSTYSVSSTLPIFFENKTTNQYKSSSSTSSRSTINVEEEITPIDDMIPFRQHRPETKIRNRAQNINHNQKNIDDDDDDLNMGDMIKISDGRISLEYMPSSFMFILQILLLSCLLNRLLIPNDLNIIDLMMNNVSSSVVTETEESRTQTLWKHVLLSVFHQ